MTKLNYEENGNFHSIELKQKETVLDGLLRSGISTPNACRSGVCHTCIMQSNDLDSIPTDAQKGLNEIQIESGKFLACCCIPTQTIAASSTAKKHVARVLSKQILGDSVIRLRLTKPFEYSAGQYVTIENSNQEEDTTLTEK